MNYKKLKEIQQEECNKLPIYWAFSDEQLNEVLKEMNIKKEEMKKIGW